jgi:hypothetical protein
MSNIWDKTSLNSTRRNPIQAQAYMLDKYTESRTYVTGITSQKGPVPTLPLTSDAQLRGCADSMLTSVQAAKGRESVPLTNADVQCRLVLALAYGGQVRRGAAFALATHTHIGVCSRDWCVTKD